MKNIIKNNEKEKEREEESKTLVKRIIIRKKSEQKNNWGRKVPSMYVLISCLIIILNLYCCIIAMTSYKHTELM